MSIYADTYVVDEITGESKLIKHLNQDRIDRGYKCGSDKNNKSGKKARNKKQYNQKQRFTEKKFIEDSLTNENTDNE